MRTRISAVATVLLALGMLTGAGAAVADPGPGDSGSSRGSVIPKSIDPPKDLCGSAIHVIGTINPAFSDTCVSRIHADW